MSVTQRDIAKRLNVSRALVAGVLSGYPGVRASKEMREQIVATARELNYRPNTVAISLRSGKTRAVALVFAPPPSQVYRSLYSGIIETLAEILVNIDYRLVVATYKDQAAVLDGLRDIASARTCDAAVLWGKPGDVIEQGELLARLGIPFTAIGRYENIHPEWPQVDFDHEAIMESAVERLVKSGHRHIAYVGFTDNEPYSNAFYAGFKNGIVSSTGRRIDDTYVCGLPAEKPQQMLRAQLRAWLDMPDSSRPTAIVNGCSNDEVWTDFEMFLLEAGLRIGDGPNEITVVGIGRQMLFGEADCLLVDNVPQLARIALERLLIPILQGESLDETIIRVQSEVKRISPNYFKNIRVAGCNGQTTLNFKV